MSVRRQVWWLVVVSLTTSENNSQMARHTFEGFLIKSFGVGRDTFNPIFKVKRHNFDLATPAKKPG